MPQYTEEQLMELWYEQEMRERRMMDLVILEEIPEDFEVNEASVIADDCSSVVSPVEAGML